MQAASASPNSSSTGEAPTPAGVVAATPGVQPALRELVERVTLGDTEEASTAADVAGARRRD